MVKESEATIAAAISQWKERTDRFELNATFREDTGDSLLVLVFGLVKSGKSSLGNFVAHGSHDPEPSAIENLRCAGQAPSYFVRALADDGADTQVADEELSRRGKFVVDVEEATSAIQGFKLGGLTWIDPNVAINVVCHAAFSRYFKDLMVGIAVLFNLTCGESERQSKIDTRSCEIGDLPTIG